MNLTIQKCHYKDRDTLHYKFGNNIIQKATGVILNGHLYYSCGNFA